jgi:predicted restriction endonuclease
MITKKCFHCGVKTTNPKFCSKSCAAKTNNKIPKRKISKKCSNCNSIVRNYRSTLCELHYQEWLKTRKENLLNQTLEQYTERKSIKRLHPSSKFAHIRGLCRSWHKEKLKLPCHVCGYSKHVELAHIKSLSSFSPTATLQEVNSSSNVIQLCPNCHWEFDNGLIILAFPEQSEFT